MTGGMCATQFRVVEIDVKSLPDPAYAFSVLHERVTGRYCLPHKATENLDKYWSLYSEQRRCTVLLLDGADHTVTYVLCKLVEWCTYPFARLILISIADNVDLPLCLSQRESCLVILFDLCTITTPDC